MKKQKKKKQRTIFKKNTYEGRSQQAVVSLDDNRQFKLNLKVTCNFIIQAKPRMSPRIHFTTATVINLIKQVGL